MENRSFEGDSAGGSLPKDLQNNPPGPSKSRTDFSGESKDLANKNKPPIARISDDEDKESPPAYVQRYATKKQKIPDDFDNLEPPPTDPVQEPRDDRSKPELLAAARKRQELRNIQQTTQGLCSLRADPPNLPPLPPPQPYPNPDPNIGQQAADADNPEQQGAIVGQQAVVAPDAGQQAVVAPDAGQQAVIAPDAGQQAVVAPDAGQQAVIAPDAGQQADNATVRSATWMESCVSCYETVTTFNFQFPFHTLLLTWPLATGAMGLLNASKNHCQMNDGLLWVMMVIALTGTLAIAIRLFAIYYEKVFPNHRIRVWWFLIRLAELITWALFCTQLYFFFRQPASFDPADTHYCKPRIYRINCGLIFLGSTLMIGWIVVNVSKFIYWCTSRIGQANN